MAVNQDSMLYQIGLAVKTKINQAVDRSDSYSENTYDSNGNLTDIDIWEDNTKAVVVGSKEFTYTSGNLTQVVEKNASGTTTLTKTIAYDGDGNVSSITKDYA